MWKGGNFAIQLTDLLTIKWKFLTHPKHCKSKEHNGNHGKQVTGLREIGKPNDLSCIDKIATKISIKPSDCKQRNPHCKTGFPCRSKQDKLHP